MVTNLGEAKARARALFRSGDYPRALQAYDQILTTVPLDHDVRFKVADILAKTGLAEEAAEVYSAVAIHDIRAGHPLAAIVACQALKDLGKPTDEILHLLASLYASGSPQLARFAVRLAPCNPETPVPMAEDAPEPFDKLADRARRRALDLSAVVSYQEQYHPLPFFSELGAEALIAVVNALTVKRFADSEIVIRQGDIGSALYLVASGEVTVFATAPGGVSREVARFYENSLFGEMALMTDQPRAASVAVVGEADIIEVSRAMLSELAARLPAIAEALGRFTRERLIKNLLFTSPLFQPFSKTQQADLLRRFEGHDVPAKTEIIREGEAGKGLFIVLSGEVDVLRADTTLATLRAGDVFGEMSLLANQPTSATVRAVTPTSVLFLARGYFERLVAGVPEVRTYFESVAAERGRNNSLRLGRRGVPEEPVEIDITDAILL